MQEHRNLPSQGGESPFDAGRTPCPQGGEDRWSARWLMEQMGYESWQKFEGVIERAKTAAHNQGFNPKILFRINTEKPSGNEVFTGAGKNLGGRPKTDYSVTRFAAYLIAMNGDPRKPEVAAAQAYFALRTREAETASSQFAIPSTYAEALAVAAEQAKQVEVEQKKNLQLVAAIKRDAPLIAKAEAHTTSDSMVHRQAFAREVQQWGMKQGVKVLHEYVYELLRRKGMLVAGERSDRNHATSHAVTSGWAWTKKDTTDTGHATATTYLHPRGQDIAWKWITAHVEEFGTLAPQDRAA